VEYLTQLLGEISPEISQFVENIGRYTRGEHLIQDVEESKILKISATQSPPPISASVTTLEGIAITHAAPSKHVSAQNNGRTQKQQSKSRVPPPKSKLMTTVVPSDPSEIRTSTGGSIDRELVASRLSSESVSGEREKADKPVDKKLTPKKGKATKVCGCYGTLHKPLTNCLYCGRISCVEEGYDYCPFCGFMVEDIRDGKEYVYLLGHLWINFARKSGHILSYRSLPF
jgi:Putative zinc finger motif, C2HC5-type